MSSGEEATGLIVDAIYRLHYLSHSDGDLYYRISEPLKYVGIEDGCSVWEYSTEEGGFVTLWVEGDTVFAIVPEL